MRVWRSSTSTGSDSRSSSSWNRAASDQPDSIFKASSFELGRQRQRAQLGPVDLAHAHHQRVGGGLEVVHRRGRDIGAADLTEHLAARLGATAVLQRYSRLVIDCNRDPQRADAVPMVSDGQPVPANRDLSPEARAHRVAEIHAPYHAAIQAELDAQDARGSRPLPVFVHSFTPRLAGMTADRPWSFGVLHAGASPMSFAVLDLLRREGGFEVGDNEPYAMSEVDYSAPRHAIARGRDYLELEVRQDLIARPEGVAWASDLLARLLPLALSAVADPPGGENA